MTWFRLAADCFLVEGDGADAVYDVHGGRVLVLDEAARNVLRRCEANEPLTADINPAARCFLDALEEAGLGAYEDSPAYVEKLLLHQPTNWQGMCMQPPNFSRADWSLTDRCDRNCTRCGGGEETLTWEGCRTCLRRSPEGGETWMPEHPAALVAEIAALGVRTLHIRGGNPLLAWDALSEVAGASAAHGLETVITTPGTGRAPAEVAALCRDTGARCIVVLPACETDAVERAAPLLDTLAAAGLHGFITVLLTPETQPLRSALGEAVAARWNCEPSFAEVCLRSDIRPGFRLSHVTDAAKPMTPWVNGEAFFFRRTGNTCTFGAFEIGADGKIRTCIGLGDVHGDVAADGLRRALSGDGLYAAWERNKSRVSPCHRCALRLACADCTAFEAAGEHDAAAKEAYCPLDPADTAQAARVAAWGNSGFVRGVTLA